MTAIQLEGVSRRYRGTTALAELSLSVPAGSFYGLIGKSGAGKTTTLRILLGFLRPSAGRVEVLGAPAARIASLSGRVGATLDRPALYPHLTVLQHLESHARAHGQRVDPHPILERLGLEQRRGQRAGRLSAGERQRLSLARALLLEPELLVLDEPLIHLDPHSTARVMEALAEATACGATVFLSSHQLDQVERFCDHVALLDGGRLLLAGRTHDLLAASGSRGLGVRVTATPGDRAEATLREHALVQELETEPVASDGADGPTLRLWLSEPRPDEINAALHRAGCRVSRLEPTISSLDELFLATLREAEGSA